MRLPIVKCMSFDTKMTKHIGLPLAPFQVFLKNFRIIIAKWTGQSWDIEQISFFFSNIFLTKADFLLQCFFFLADKTFMLKNCYCYWSRCDAASTGPPGRDLSPSMGCWRGFNPHQQRKKSKDCARAFSWSSWVCIPTSPLPQPP